MAHQTFIMGLRELFLKGIPAQREFEEQTYRKQVAQSGIQGNMR